MSLSGKCDKLMSNLFCPEMPDLWFYPLPLVGEKRSEHRGCCVAVRLAQLDSRVPVCAVPVLT